MKTQRQYAALTLAAFALITAALSMAIVGHPSAAAPGVVSINFVGTGTAMGATESAGVVAKPNWNNATGATRSTPLALLDETGAASGASVTWTSNNTWSTPITDQAGNRRMMKGYLDTTTSSTTTVTVSSLPSGPYDVYVYADGDNGSASRSGGYTISGAGITTTTVTLTDAANTNFNTAFTQAANSNGNYVKFSITAAGFTLTALPGTASDGNKRAPLNGLQIVPAGPPAPDFTLSAAPGSRSVTQGGGTSYTVTLGALNGFAGTVNLAATGLPANATALFTPSSLTGSGMATLDVTTASNTPTGTTTVTISGTSGTLTRTTTVSLVVTATPDFTLAVTPASRTASPGGSASYTVTTTALNGFSGSVSLGVANLPANTTGSFSPSSISGSSSATLTVTTTASTPQGSSTLTITGTSGALSHSATTSLVVSTAPTVGTVSVKFVGSGASMGATESAGVVPKANWNNATGASRSTPLALNDETGAASGATVTWTANSMWMTPITDQAGNRRMMRGYLDTTNSSVSTVTVAGLAAGSYDVYAYGDGDNGGATRTSAYRISGMGITTTTINLTDAANTNFNTAFTQATNSNGNYVKFSISASGFTLTATPGTTSDGTARAPLNGLQIVPTAPPAPDFTLTATPPSQTVIQGSPTSYTIAIGSLNGFTGTVSLGVSGLPSNASGNFTPTSIGGSGNATLDVTTAANTPTGNPTLTITGTSAGVSHSATVTLRVTGPTFGISGAITPQAGGASATVNLGGAAATSTTATATGTYAFTGLVNGDYQVVPAKNGYSFSPSSQGVTISSASVTDVNFSASQSPNTISISSPANGATVSTGFSIAATASASIVGVQFRVDGANVGAEDTSTPYSVSVTTPSGPHTLTAVGRDATGNTVTSAPVSVTVSASSGTALAVNGNQTFQTIDGFGVNLNSLSWKNGEAIPVLDMLIDQLGVTQFRVVFDMEDWESSNDDTNAATPNWTYYNALYSNAKFQNLWGTLHYLNQRGITTGINLSFMGRVPTWMGGVNISSNMEDEWVEMMATLFYYARNTANVQFDMVDPINEPDWDGFEGPQVGSAQYTRLLQKLSVKLDTPAMGLSALRFVGPNAARNDVATSDYVPAMRANSTVMSKLDHFGFHNYAGSTGSAASAIQGSGKNFWMTESNKTADVMSLIGQNANSVQVWDAYDAVYNHAILAGRGSAPGNDDGSWPALIAYDSSTGVYTPRHEFYEMAQIFKFVPRGAVRIGANESNSSLSFYAFRDATTGRLTIVGRNISSSAITVNGTLSNLPTGGVFQLYRTDVSGNNFARGADSVVTNGSFTFTAPVNSYFTLTALQP
jgi:Bacterial Ig domain